MSESPSLGHLLREHLELAWTLRRLRIRLDSERCAGLWECYEVCPVDCWAPDRERGVVVLQNEEDCIACGACVLQCAAGAIKLEVSHA